jgi:hypothetical protein
MWIAFVAQVEAVPTIQERLYRIAYGVGAAALDLLVSVGIALAGWALAALAARVVQALLRAARFNEGVRGLFAPAGRELRFEPAAAVSWAVHWVIVLLAVMLAADVLGFDLSRSVGDRLRDVLPRVVAATIVLAAGVIIAMMAGALVRSLLAGAGVRGSRLRAQLVVAVLVGFAALMALEQLGLAAQFIMAIGLTAVASLGLAAALAFGLGCREMARDLVVEFLRASEEEGAARQPRT